MKYCKKLLCLMTALSAALLPACGKVQPEKTEPQGMAYFSYFDTVSYVYSYAGDSPEQFEKRCEEVSRILGEYHRSFDIYHEYSGMNNLCTVNRRAGGEAVPVSPELLEFLLFAKGLYDQTEGKMNIMLGSVLSLWHDCREAAANDPSSAQIPEEAALREAGMHTDIALLELDEAACTVRISDKQASLDVGAAAKGYATEKAAQYLESDGAEGYVLNIGGNIRMIGAKPDGSGWVTGIKDPQNPENILSERLLLKDTSCVTSGVYERYFTVDGVRYHHIIDPATLYPADFFASVTVITKDSGVADCLSTALFCLPYEQGIEMVKQFPGTEVIWFTADGERLSTPGAAELYR